MPPLRHEMQDVANHGSTETVVGEREPRPVRDGDRERSAATGFLHELPEHRRREIDTHHRHAGFRERERDESGADADLEATASAGQLGSEDPDHLPSGRLGHPPCPVVVLDRPVEGHRAVHDFGISLAGSTKGRAATVAARVVPFAPSSNRVPTSRCEAGTHA